MAVPAEIEGDECNAKCPCDLMLITTTGSNGSPIFHVGIRDSNGEVVEFNSCGLRVTPTTSAQVATGPSAGQLPISQTVAASLASPSNSWVNARRVRLFAKICATGDLRPEHAEAFARWWDHTLRLMLDSHLVAQRYSSSTYHPESLNCFSFVLAFLKLLRIDSLDPWLRSRGSFTQRFLLDELRSMRGYGRKFA